MYINGTSQTFQDTNADSGYRSGTYLGALINGAAHWQWTGGIDEVKVFSGALSPAQVSSLYSDSFSATVLDHLGRLLDWITDLFR